MPSNSRATASGVRRTCSSNSLISVSAGARGVSTGAAGELVALRRAHGIDDLPGLVHIVAEIDPERTAIAHDGV
ncbi:hypothetical protein GV794_29145, partial [Nocardia cyriacigeorgica]|nr:hypothetical protein [Nocardia cyriacigeorgica]